MNIETEKIMLKQIIFRKKDFFVIEDSIIIPDIKPDILSIITTSANLYVSKKDCNNDKIKIDGGVQLSTIYISDDKDNNARAIHNSLDFSKNIEIESNGQKDFKYTCNLSIKNIEPKILNGRKINIKATIEYEVIVYSSMQTQFVKAIKGDEPIQMQSQNYRFCCNKSVAETTVSAKETITIDGNLADILTNNISLRNREEKISYNKVLAKADCCVDIVYITEEEELRNVSEQIPIMGFIDMPGVSEDETIIADYEIKNIEIKPDSTDDRTILVNIDFSLRCASYEEKNVDLVQDLYSLDNELEINQRNVNLEQNKKSLQERCDVHRKFDLSDADGSSGVFIADIAENNISQRIEVNSIIYEGSLIIGYLYKSKNTKRLEYKSENIEFSHKVAIDGLEKSSEVETNYDVVMESSRKIQDLSGDIKFSVVFRIGTYNKISANIIDSVKVLDQQLEENPSSLVIYYVKEGDTMWKIAKKFKTTMNEIAELNNIENINSLQIGTQLFIPRHIGSIVYE